MENRFVINGWAAGVIAAGAMLALALVAHVVVVRTQGDRTGMGPVQRRRRGVKALIMGADGRASTSKLQVVLWTFAVLYVFVFLLVWGRSKGCGDDEARFGPRCLAAAEAREAFRDTVDGPLDAEYYVLLGFPVTAAVAAKALVTSKILTGEVIKRPIEDDADGGVVNGLSQLVTDDGGSTDLVDFQYLAFNLVTLAFFTIEFMSRPSAGLPDLPTTLVALSGLSAAAYTTKKGLEQDARPAISAVVPHRVPRVAGATLTVVGTGFGTPAPKADDGVAPAPSVLLDGSPLEVEPDWSDVRIRARLTPEALAGLPAPDGPATPAEVIVMDVCASVSAPASVELYQPAVRSTDGG